MVYNTAVLILILHPANERRRYIASMPVHSTTIFTLAYLLPLPLAHLPQQKKHYLNMLSSKTNALLTHTLASFWRKQSCSDYNGQWQRALCMMAVLHSSQPNPQRNKQKNGKCMLQAEPWWRASIWRSHRKVVIKQCSYHNNIIDIQNRLPYSKVVYPAIIVLF